MRCKSGKRYYTLGNLYSTSFILYICGNRYPISWSSQKEQIICRQMSKTSSTELKLAEDLASSELVCHTQRSGCIQFCNNEKIFHTLELIPISWSFENIRKSLSKEHKISSKELKLPKILQWRNRYDYPEGVQIKHPFCMYDTCCSTRLGGFGAPSACFTPFIQVTNKIRAYR